MAFRCLVGQRIFESIQDLAEWSGVPYAILRHRIRHGMTPEAAMRLPVKQLKRGAVAAFGKTYTNLSAAARAFGKDPEMIRNRIRSGMSLESALSAKNQREKDIIIDGARYPSVAAAARHFGVTLQTLRSRLRSGWSAEDAVSRKVMQDRPLMIESIKYPSILAAAQALGVPYKLLYKRIRLGWDPESAARMNPQLGTPVVVRGVTYPSIKAAAGATGVEPGVASYRLNAGWTPDDAFDPQAEVENLKPIQIAGRRFKTLSQAAREYGIAEVTFMKRLRSKWSPEQAAGLQPPPKFSIGKRPIARQEYLERLSLIHGRELDFGEANFQRALDKVKVRCARNKRHPTFWATPNNLLRGRGCPMCAASLGEKRIARWLEENHVEYVRQWSCPDLTSQRDKRGRLRFDFYVPSVRTLVEFDGEQHIRPLAMARMTEEQARASFKRTVENDRRKDRWAAQQEYQLIRIRFDENVHQVLERSIPPILRVRRFGRGKQSQDVG